MKMGHGRKPYARLLLMAFLSVASMYVLMYAMVDRFTNVYPNLNQFYVAALMASPMVIIELALMGGMYQSRKLNAVTIGVSGVVFVAALFGLRHRLAFPMSNS